MLREGAYKELEEKEQALQEAGAGQSRTEIDEVQTELAKLNQPRMEQLSGENESPEDSSWRKSCRDILPNEERQNRKCGNC